MHPGLSPGLTPDFSHLPPHGIVTTGNDMGGRIIRHLRGRQQKCERGVGRKSKAAGLR